MKNHVKKMIVLLLVGSIVLLSCFKDPPVLQRSENVLASDSLPFLHPDLPGNLYNVLIFITQ